MRRKRVQGGFFISFEGGEGAGKTSQINRLAEALVAEGYDVVTTREPGGTKEGEKLRALLVQREGGNWNAMSEILLFFAAQSLHVEQVIKPALAEGKIVISDRFSDSTMAYQGYGRGADLEKLKALQKIVLDDFAPHLTLIFDIDVAEGIGRSTKRLAAEAHGYQQTEDRFERMDMPFHERIRQGFLAIAEKSGARCRVIDAARSPEAVAQEIKGVVSERLSVGGERHELV